MHLYRFTNNTVFVNFHFVKAVCTIYVFNRAIAL